MDQSPGSCTPEEFASWVRDALSNLYDSAHLEHHQLVPLLTESGSATTRSQALRTVLLDAIEAQRPAADCPSRSPHWRTYRLLEVRYVEGRSYQESMVELGLAKTQFYQERAHALDQITRHLATKIAQPAAAQTEAPDQFEQIARAEMERLYANARWESIDAAQVLVEVAALLARAASVATPTIDLHMAQPLVVRRADRVMLRQVLLTLLTAAVQHAAGSQITVADDSADQHVGLCVSIAPSRAMPASVSQPEIGLRICHWLMLALGGKLELSAAGTDWQARLLWPRQQLNTLLVVDDNPDMAALFRRYVGGQPWHVVGTQNGTEARRALTQCQPALIIMDIMMPEEDGWELLLALRNTAQTQHTPIIICSVLTEPHFARALGATAYLPKPVSQQSLLQALADWTRPHTIQQPVTANYAR